MLALSMHVAVPGAETAYSEHMVHFAFAEGECDQRQPVGAFSYVPHAVFLFFK